VAFFAVAAILLFTLVTLPFVFSDVAGKVGGSDNRVYELVSAKEAATQRTRVHISLESLNDWGNTITVQVSGHQVCDGDCPWSDRLLLVAARNQSSTEGLPASGAVSLPALDKVVTQSVVLPIKGDPIRYPFDSYHVRLGVVLQHVLASGSVETVAPAEAIGHVFISLQLNVPNMDMPPPVHEEAAAFAVADAEYQYLDVSQLTFTRPLRLKLLAILLVMLVSAGAAYAVFLRPLDQLVLSAGSLILGVWGIRSILLTPNTPPGAAIIDITLSMIILFLLAAMSIRALRFYDERSGYRVTDKRFKRRKHLAEATPTPAAGEHAPPAAAAEHTTVPAPAATAIDHPATVPATAAPLSPVPGVSAPPATAAVPANAASGPAASLPAPVTETPSAVATAAPIASSAQEPDAAPTPSTGAAEP